MTARVTLAGVLLGVITLLAAALMKPVLRIVYNASDSAPRGWYWIVHADRFRVGDTIVALLPERVAVLAASRRYLPRSVPVLKHIAAISGQRVCIRDGAVAIDGAVVARVLEVDRSGRPLTAWLHCRRLVRGEIFLLNAAAPASFDSRYFGPLDVSFVLGLATPLLHSP